MSKTLVVAILIVCFKPGSGLLSRKPQDSDAVVGKSAYFNCSTSEPSKRIQWYHYDDGEAQRESIYLCDNHTEYWYPCYRNGRYVVERKPATGEYNLVIPTVVASDAGRFLCEVDGDEGIATLTVQVESNPTCVASSELCKPYTKPYSAAIICIFLIVLPALLIGGIILLWYLRVYRPKKLKQKDSKGEGFEEEAIKLSGIDSEVNKEVEEKAKLTNTKASSQGETEPPISTKTDYTTKIKELENVVQVLRNELKSERDDVENLKKKIKASDKENSQLATSLTDLEQRLYPAGNFDYAKKPTLAHTITAEPINGMTVLAKALFVIHDNDSTIAVYNLETFKFVRNWDIKGMLNPMDIASCKIANCIYIILEEENEKESQIIKFDPEGKLINKWPTEGKSGRLSTYESKVIVCLFDKNLIHEYTGDGDLTLTVNLLTANGFNYPLHAIKVSSSHFAVCHGAPKDASHRVCIVDVHGKIIKERRDCESENKDGKFNVPICLAEDSERSILVADRDNQQIRLLNCHLKFQRNLLKKELGHPVRICLDEGKGQLFVAANNHNKKERKEGKILIFNIK